MRVHIVFVGNRDDFFFDTMEFPEGLSTKKYEYEMSSELFSELRGEAFRHGDYGDSYMTIVGVVEEGEGLQRDVKTIRDYDIIDRISADNFLNSLNSMGDRETYHEFMNNVFRYDECGELREPVSFDEPDVEPDTTDENKGGVTMINNLKFGKYEGNSAKATLMGLAVKGHDGRFTSVRDGKTIDTTMFTDGANMDVMMVPMPLDSIEEDDIILHNGTVCKVEAFFGDDRLSVVDIGKAEEKTIIPIASPFGFSFVTKLVSMFDLVDLDTEGTDNKEMMLAMAMMASNGNADNSDTSGMSAMLPLMLMKDTNSKDSGSKDMMMMMAMMSMGNGGDMNSMMPMLMLMK